MQATASSLQRPRTATPSDRYARPASRRSTPPSPGPTKGASSFRQASGFLVAVVRVPATGLREVALVKRLDGRWEGQRTMPLGPEDLLAEVPLDANGNPPFLSEPDAEVHLDECFPVVSAKSEHPPVCSGEPGAQTSNGEPLPSQITARTATMLRLLLRLIHCIPMPPA